MLGEVDADDVTEFDGDTDIVGEVVGVVLGVERNETVGVGVSET